MADEKDKPKEKDMEKEYDALKKKYNLPEFKELDREFCVGKLEETSFILRSILSKITERLEWVFKTLSDIVQPSESSLAAMYEAEMFSDDEKKGIFDLMKRLAFYHRELIIKDLNYSDDAVAAAIIKFYNEWLGMKKDIVKVVEHLRDSWKNELKSKSETGYFG